MSDTNREILFRGKRVDNGEWIEGYYCPKPFSAFLCKPCIFPYKTINYNWRGFEVYPKTIGQYTGLTDKNGTKIFEGDIVVTTKFNTPSKKYVIKYNEALAAFIGEDLLNNMYFTTFDGDADMFEVIGNIHDNPELIKQ